VDLCIIHYFFISDLLMSSELVVFEYNFLMGVMLLLGPVARDGCCGWGAGGLVVSVTSQLSQLSPI